MAHHFPACPPATGGGIFLRPQECDRQREGKGYGAEARPVSSFQFPGRKPRPREPTPVTRHPKEPTPVTTRPHPRCGCFQQDPVVGPAPFPSLMTASITRGSPPSDCSANSTDIPSSEPSPRRRSPTSRALTARPSTTPGVRFVRCGGSGGCWLQCHTGAELSRTAVERRPGQPPHFHRPQGGRKGRDLLETLAGLGPRLLLTRCSLTTRPLSRLSV